MGTTATKHDTSLQACINNIGPGCDKHAYILTIPAGTLIFTGIKNEHSDIDQNILYKKLGQTDFSKTTIDVITSGKLAVFVEFALNGTVITYAKNNVSSTAGAAIIARLDQDINLIVFANANCMPFFDNHADYQTDDFQCFCKSQNGYATLYKNILTDVVICDAHKISTVIGYIPKPANADDLSKFVQITAPLTQTEYFETMTKHSEYIKNKIADTIEEPTKRGGRDYMGFIPQIVGMMSPMTFMIILILIFTVLCVYYVALPSVTSERYQVNTL